MSTEDAAAQPAAPKKKPLPPRSERRGAERAPTDLVDNRRRLWTRLKSEYDFTSRYLPVDGHWLHYVDEGPRDAPPVLLVHGNPTWSFYWRGLIESLRDKHRVIAIDLVGMGFSEKPQDFDYCLANHTAVLESFVEELRLRNITLGLHDWGGAIGMGFARRHPELIRALIVTNTSAFPSAEMPKLIGTARTRFPGSFLVRRLGLFSKIALRTTLHRRKGGLNPVEKLAYLQPYKSYTDRVAIDAFVKDIPMDPSHRSWGELEATAEALEQFKDRPTLIAWGMRDFVFRKSFLDEWVRRLPEAQVQRFDDCGHWLMEEAPAEISKLVAEFLNGLESVGSVAEGEAVQAAD